MSAFWSIVFIQFLYFLMARFKSKQPKKYFKKKHIKSFTLYLMMISQAFGIMVQRKIY